MANTRSGNIVQLINERKFADALKIAYQAIAVGENTESCYVNIGICKYQLARAESSLIKKHDLFWGAIDAFEQALKYTKSLKYYEFTAYCYEYLAEDFKNTDDEKVLLQYAISAYTEFLNKQTHGSIFRSRAKLYFRLRSFDACYADLERACRIDYALLNITDYLEGFPFAYKEKLLADFSNPGSIFFQLKAQRFDPMLEGSLKELLSQIETEKKLRSELIHKEKSKQQAGLNLLFLHEEKNKNQIKSLLDKIPKTEYGWRESLFLSRYYAQNSNLELALHFILPHHELIREKIQLEIDLKRFDEALIDLKKNTNKRLIALCYFQLNQYEKSYFYYQKIMNKVFLTESEKSNIRAILTVHLSDDLAKDYLRAQLCEDSDEYRKLLGLDPKFAAELQSIYDHLPRPTYTGQLTPQQTLDIAATFFNPKNELPQKRDITSELYQSLR